MSPTSPSHSYSLENVVERICTFRQITPVDRDLLAHALSHQSYFGRHEQSLVDRVFDGIHQGWIWVADT